MARLRARKTKTRRGRRILEEREPKTVENDKNALIVRGGKTSELVTNTLAEINALKKPLVRQMKRRNPIHPFEDDTPIEKFSTKFDSSLFVFGSNSKKHPNSLIFGRTYDYHILDMVELRVENLVRANEFKTAKATLGTKPCLILQGTNFESDPTMKRVGNLMVDWFRGPTVEKIRLQGLEVVISLTAVGNKLLFRTYRVYLKKSASTLPRVELLEMGPRIDFSLQRTKLASEDLFKTALKRPKQLTAKRRKNLSTDVFGTKLARVHVGKQNIDALQTRKLKALRRGNLETTDQHPMEE
ncbi:Ribosome production factor 2 -like protein [Toxocara canis]|uniref:Ribosome production factor 2 homolog n=1 Tax=Toxocara canis TaxID=6265 RepID=A0A0B2UND6_TOXCA|nr:Ribosome production factor 2 -like protein [Toxocara canis]